MTRIDGCELCLFLVSTRKFPLYGPGLEFRIGTMLSNLSGLAVSQFETKPHMFDCQIRSHFQRIGFFFGAGLIMLVSCCFSSNHFWYHWLCSCSGRSRIYPFFLGKKLPAPHQVVEPESSAVVVKVCGCLRGCLVKPGWIENMQPNSQLVQIKLCGCKSARNDNCRLVEN